jgi:hypothetical protein
MENMENMEELEDYFKTEEFKSKRFLERLKIRLIFAILITTSQF